MAGFANAVAPLPSGEGKGRVRPTGTAPRLAVMIPCYNEEATIAGVVAAFRSALPKAALHVYDNNSSDLTAERAAGAGAVVRRAPLQGKGETVRLMFADVEADVYVLVDGDGTYEAAAAPRLIEALVSGGLDMVSGARVSQDAGAYRLGHAFGNRMLTGMVRLTFGRRFNDLLSGYRVFSRRFVKSFPAASTGFEIETELTVHVLQMRLPAIEIDTAYGARPVGSASKLNTVRDGLRILRMIGLLLRDERPLQFFGLAALLLVGLAFGLGWPILHTYISTGLVPRLPTLVVSMGLGIAALLSLTCGLILDAVTRMRLEQRRFAYLSIPALPAEPGP